VEAFVFWYDLQLARLDVEDAAAVIHFTDASAASRRAKSGPDKEIPAPIFVDDAAVHSHFSVAAGAANRNPVADIDGATGMKIINSASNSSSVAGLANPNFAAAIDRAAHMINRAGARSLSVPATVSDDKRVATALVDHATVHVQRAGSIWRFAQKQAAIGHIDCPAIQGEDTDRVQSVGDMKPTVHIQGLAVLLNGARTISRAAG